MNYFDLERLSLEGTAHHQHGGPNIATFQGTTEKEHYSEKKFSGNQILTQKQNDQLILPDVFETLLKMHIQRFKFCRKKSARTRRNLKKFKTSTKFHLRRLKKQIKKRKNRRPERKHSISIDTNISMISFINKDGANKSLPLSSDSSLSSHPNSQFFGGFNSANREKKLERMDEHSHVEDNRGILQPVDPHSLAENKNSFNQANSPITISHHADLFYPRNNEEIIKYSQHNESDEKTGYTSKFALESHNFLPETYPFTPRTSQQMDLARIEDEEERLLIERYFNEDSIDFQSHEFDTLFQVEERLLPDIEP